MAELEDCGVNPSFIASDTFIKNDSEKKKLRVVYKAQQSSYLELEAEDEWDLIRTERKEEDVLGKNTT